MQASENSSVTKEFTEHERELIGTCPRCATLLRLMKANSASMEAELSRCAAGVMEIARHHYSASLRSLANCKSLDELHDVVEAFESGMAIEVARARPTEH
jgi:hypothetical protein